MLFWLPCQAPGVLGSVLGLAGWLAGSVSVYFAGRDSTFDPRLRSVAARTFVRADASQRHTSLLLEREATYSTNRRGWLCR